MGKKRSLEAEQHEDIVEKKQKVANMVHRIRVSNLPERDLPMVKKYFKSLGYNRFKKAPLWSYGYITVDVKLYLVSILFDIYIKYTFIIIYLFSLKHLQRKLSTRLAI